MPDWTAWMGIFKPLTVAVMAARQLAILYSPTRVDFHEKITLRLNGLQISYLEGKVEYSFVKNLPSVWYCK